jgi:hypothetical protein
MPACGVLGECFRPHTPVGPCRLVRRRQTGIYDITKPKLNHVGYNKRALLIYIAQCMRFFITEQIRIRQRPDSNAVQDYDTAAVNHFTLPSS